MRGACVNYARLRSEPGTSKAARRALGAEHTRHQARIGHEQHLLFGHVDQQLTREPRRLDAA